MGENETNNSQNSSYEDYTPDNQDNYIEDNSFDNQGVGYNQNFNHNQNSIQSFSNGLHKGINNRNKINPATDKNQMGDKKNNNPNNDNLAKGNNKKDNNENQMPGRKKADDKNSNPNQMPGAKKNNNNQNAKDGDPRKRNENSNTNKTPNQNKNKSISKSSTTNKAVSKKTPNGKDALKKEMATGLKTLWTAIPIQAKIVIAAGVSIMLILALILLAVTTMTATGVAIGASMCDESSYGSDVWSDANISSFICSMKDPLDGNYTVSSLYGWRAEFSTDHMHSGIDLAGSTGTPVTAVHEGEVVFAGNTSGYGNLVQIKHGDKINTLYGHLNSISVKKGDKVKQGQEIGRRGNTGHSFGSHLHFEIRNGESSNDTVSPNAYFGYSDKGYERCLDRSKSPQYGCNIDTSGKARKIKQSETGQICGITSNYNNNGDNSDCCETANTSKSSLVDFIRTFEGSGGYCGSSKKEYKAYQNSGDRVTIGYGVTSDYLPQLKRAGQCISVTTVDAAELKAIEAKRTNVIKKNFQNVELNQNQEDAMVSMAYNGCGQFFQKIAAASKTGNLKQVWNAMKGCNNGGILNYRRKAEFDLYVTGDYSAAERYKGKSYTSAQYDDYDSDGVIARKASGSASSCSSSSGSTDIAKRANEEYEKWNNASSNSARSKMLQGYMKACSNRDGWCNDWCAGFVSYILQETGKLEHLSGYNCLAASYNTVKAKDSSVTVEHHKAAGYTPKAGDVFVRGTKHVGLVEYVEGKTIHTIEGNTSGSKTASCWPRSVNKHTYQIGGGGITHYVTIK